MTREVSELPLAEIEALAAQDCDCSWEQTYDGFETTTTRSRSCEPCRAKELLDEV